MKKRPVHRKEALTSEAQAVGRAALASYNDVLAFLGRRGKGQQTRQPSHAELPFIQRVPGIEGLFHSLSAAAPAIPDTSAEEWNPLSQRPHVPLPPAVGDELGAEVTALKEAIDAFTTLTHEMMHVALWEPYFAGHWRPRRQSVFREFSLMAEGFCFFFSDIVVSGAVRVRLPDGEFALERRTPSNALFHPARAFQALGIEDPEAILEIYLAGFSGQKTALWQPRGSNNFVAKLAAQVYDFYAGSQRYLDEAHAALVAFGGLSEFHRRFCAIPGLPSFLEKESAPSMAGTDLQRYFVNFFRTGLEHLERLTTTKMATLRWRRMLQMRAYYALQVRWLLRSDLVVARRWSLTLGRKLAEDVEAYLEGLSVLLKQLTSRPDTSLADDLSQLDMRYDTEVRSCFAAHDAWAGHRWLIAPRRAGGLVNVCDTSSAMGREAKIELLRSVAFVVDELTHRMRDSKTIETRTEVLAQIQRLAAIGAAGGRGNAAQTRTTARRLRAELSKPHLLAIWSLPLTSFDPMNNQFRELAFSYQ